MRKIKFRAWNKIDKVMITKLFSPSLHEGLLIADSDDILMQWTGLLDKKGKEIFEGDICLSDSEVNGFIVFHNARFCWTDGYGHWDIVRNESDGPKDDALTRVHDMEVIGNLWESPELLNG